MPERPLVLAAPAKINLYLDVGDVRPDGYHGVTTVLQALEFHDTVTVAAAPSLKLVCEPEAGVEESANTAYRAALAFGARAGQEPAVAIRVRKRIPTAAGLGGGSADAAAVIVALARRWGEDPVGERAMSAAAEVGADVPFFLVGGAALFDRRGDRLVRRLPSLDAHVVLVNPQVAAPTADVYAAFDSQTRLASPGLRAITDPLRMEQGDVSAAVRGLFNALGPAAQAVAPQVLACRQWLEEQAGVLGCDVAGSGATVFGLCDDVADAQAAAAAARERGWWSVATRTRSGGAVEIEEAESS